jgi:predicted Rossmann fold flavoprotein
LKKIVVVGAGPAGLMAAVQAAELGARVMLAEKKARVGSKLSITGNGRCNLTISVEAHDLIRGFPGNGRFLHSVFFEFSNTDLRNFFHKRGLQTKVERENRIFPVTDKAEDVVKVLFNNVRKTGVEMLLSTTVTGIILEDGELKGISSDRGDFAADAVIIATGGDVLSGHRVNR